MRSPILVLSVALFTLVLGCAADAPEEAAAHGGLQRGRFRLLGQVVEVDYAIVDGRKMLGDDVVLEREDELDAAPVAGGARLSPSLLAEQRDDVGLWPGGVVPFTIDSSVSATHRARIEVAIAEWEAKTAVRFSKRAGEAAYLTFTEPDDNGLCRASLGYVAGARRYVYLRDSTSRDECNQGVVVHEIGHVLGLLHEQQRPDREQYVKINPACIPDGLAGAFSVLSTGARRLGDYDIESTMHYRSTTLTKSGCYSITAKNGTALLHDWATLSKGDIAGMETLYGPKPAPAVPPPAEPPPPEAAPPPPPVEPAAPAAEEPPARPRATSDVRPDPESCAVASPAPGRTRFAAVALAAIALALGRRRARRRA